MLDITHSASPIAPKTGAPSFQRVRGRAEVALSADAGATRLQNLAQAGSAKAFLPKVEGAPEVVFLNTAGGLTGGDRLEYTLSVEAGGQAIGTTQTAERAYASRADTGVAEMAVRLRAGAGARLAWLPQETILFEGSALQRQTEAELQGDAELLLCEALVLGRAAMGEDVTRLSLFDRRAIRREGQPAFVDAVGLGDEAIAPNPAGLGVARAVALLALVAPGAEDAVRAVRPLLAQDGVRAAASGWDGRCIIRLMAGDGWPLRVALARLIRHFRARQSGAGTGDLPRVWQI